MANARSLVEGPRIYPAVKDLTPLPDSGPVTQDRNGKRWIREDVAIEGARLGPYDTVMDFGTSRASLRGLVPQEERLTDNVNNLTVLAFEQPLVGQAMDMISLMANDHTKSSTVSDDRRDYRGHLARVYKAMAEEVITWGGKEGLIFPPLNGGRFVKDVFEGVFKGPLKEDSTDLPVGNYFDYRMSRVQTRNGGLMVGTTVNKDNPQIADFRRFVFADDCLASDISAFGTLEMIKGELKAANVPISEAEVLITVSAATQRGVESLLSPEARKHFGFGSIKLVAGILVYQMNDHFYLQHPDGTYVVADMGEWTKPLDA